MHLFKEAVNGEQPTEGDRVEVLRSHNVEKRNGSTSECVFRLRQLERLVEGYEQRIAGLEAAAEEREKL